MSVEASDVMDRRVAFVTRLDGCIREGDLACVKEMVSEGTKLFGNDGSQGMDTGDGGTDEVYDEEHWMAECIGTRPWHTLIHTAAVKGDCDIVRLLLDNGADANQCNFKRETPLFLAVVESHLDVVQLLLERGADPNYSFDLTQVHGFEGVYQPRVCTPTYVLTWLFEFSTAWILDTHTHRTSPKHE
eukprot:m.278000 g.278000  ORF g.278000 m.278000 type:complete len:187 (+) comp15735_c0_seq4:200-760(+)